MKWHLSTARIFGLGIVLIALSLIASPVKAHSGHRHMDAGTASQPVHATSEASAPIHITVRKDSDTELRAFVEKQTTKTHSIICDGVDCCCGAPCPHCCPIAMLDIPSSDRAALHYAFDFPDTPALPAYIHGGLRRPPRTFA